MSDVIFDMTHNRMEVLHKSAEPWRVTLVDTGDETLTGGRLKRVQAYVGEEDFCFTYGDGVSDIDITALIKFHTRKGKLATVTAITPPSRFGVMEIENNIVHSIKEKPQRDGSWIDGGFFVLSPKVMDYIDGDTTIWERDAMERLVRDEQLNAFHHHGFWHSMDTLRDKNYLDELWRSGRAPWKVW